MIRHTAFFVDSIKAIKFCNANIYEVSGSRFELPFETKPTEGEHDYKYCQSCNDNYKIIFNSVKRSFEKFPFCCEAHANLAKEKWFNKNFFGDIPSQVANKVIFTNQHIINNVDDKNWYKIVTDYVDYTVQSLGLMPEGCGEPVQKGYFLRLINELIKTNKDLPPEKSKRITEYINSYINPKETQKTDLNVLINTYQDWLSIFPFELSYFKELKQYYEKHLPILKGKPEYNPYLGTSRSKMHTKNSLIKELINVTENLLQQVNGVNLYKKGLIKDEAQIQIELINENRRLKLHLLKGKPTDEKKEYIKMLKRWFKDEKKYFEEITPFLNKTPQPEEQDGTEKHQGQISNCFNNLEKGDLILQIIDLYNIEKEKYNKAFRSNCKFDKTLMNDLANKIFDLFEKKQIESDASWFIEELSRLRLCGTFDNLAIAEDVMNNFKKLEIEPPLYVMNCYKEICARTKYIDVLINEKKYTWDEQEINTYKAFLDKEFQQYTFDDNSRKNYLSKLFDRIVSEIKEIEENTVKEYGYFIDGFYDSEVFIATKDNINNYFYSSEMQKRSINDFYDLVKKLRNYIDAKNKLVIVRKYILGKKEPEPIETNTLQEATTPFDSETINLFCKSMPLKMVIQHFEVFTQRKSKNGKPFLTEEEFNSFIKRAFLGKEEEPKQTFNMATREKLFLVKRFYQFYDMSWKEYENTQQCQEKYIRLLTDNFTNWDYQQTKNNFGDKVKRKW